MGLPAKLRPLLARPAARWWPAALAVVLCLPALGAGYVLDDYFHQFVLENRADGRVPTMVRAPHDLYSFIPADPAYHIHTREVAGTLPWYAARTHQVEFMRPLSSWSLYLDWLVAPGSTTWAHAHNLLWMAALVLAVGAIFRRLFASAWVAGLATLLFAVEDAHAFPAAWIANRNATIALTFGALALLCHIRWRQARSRLCGALAPVSLGVGLLAGEAALAITAYLFAYALFLDGQHLERRPGLTARMATLLPCAAVSVAWVVTYSALGYGVSGSAMYLDPLRDPAGYLAALVPRLSALLQGQLVGIDPIALFFLPERFKWLFAAGASLVVVGILLVCRGPLRQSPLARFFVVGMVIGLLPQCATFTQDRQLLAAGIGGLGLVALMLAGREDRESFVEGYWSRRFVRALAALWVAVHLVLAPLLLPLKTHVVGTMGRCFDNGARSLNRVDPLKRDTKLVFVTGPDIFFTSWSTLIRYQQGLSSVAKVRILGTTLAPVRIERVDTRSLRLVAPKGFHTSSFDTAILDPRHRWSIGERHRVGEISLEIRRLDKAGRPVELLCRFPRDLDELAADPDHALVAWHPDGYHRFVPPPIGRAVDVPGTTPRQLLELGLRAPGSFGESRRDRVSPRLLESPGHESVTGHAALGGGSVVPRQAGQHATTGQ